ncbi:MAG: hypothetical protein HC905_04805 [Bacteroidales bacterium]|nr:hypothetical protein [Bacteroidales bacterium]
MKYLKISFTAVIAIMLLFGCKKDEINSAKKEFAIKDMSGNVVTSLPTDLLSSVHQDLIQKGRKSDANTLYELYDQETGYLKTAPVTDKIAKQISLSDMKVDSSEMVVNDDTLSITSLKSLSSLKSWEQNYVYLYAHCRARGDMGPFQQAPDNYNYTSFPYFAGTTGEERRLEAMMIQSAQFLAPTRPDIKYQLIKPDGSVSYPGTGTWGVWVGTKGQSLAVIGLQMWSDTPGFHIWYIAHNQSTGWNGGWHNDGQFAGTYGKRLEAYAMQILQY